MSKDNMDTSRKETRASESHAPRAREERKDDLRTMEWLAPSMIPDPEPQEGFVFRWIAIEVNGSEVRSHTSLRLREGWTPVRAEEQPVLSGYCDSSSDGTLKFGGLMLCKMPEQLSMSRKKHFEDLAKSAQRSVDQKWMDNQNSMMPKSLSIKSKVSFGSS